MCLNVCLYIVNKGHTGLASVRIVVAVKEISMVKTVSCFSRTKQLLKCFGWLT